MTPVEEFFLKRLQQGDAGAFSELFEQYHRSLYVLAYRYLGVSEAAEDAVQYTFMKIWERRESLVFTDGVEGLLFTVMKYYVFSELRHQKTVMEKHEQLLRSGEDSGDCFLSVLEDRNVKEHLWKAIAGLPIQKQEVCRLKIGLGLSNKDIADRMNISISTVKSHYTQAIKILREILGNATVSLILFCFFKELIKWNELILLIDGRYF